MKMCDNPCNPTSGIKLTLSLFYKSVPLSAIMKDDES